MKIEKYKSTLSFFYFTIKPFGFSNWVAYSDSLHFSEESSHEQMLGRDHRHEFNFAFFRCCFWVLKFMFCQLISRTFGIWKCLKINSNQCKMILSNQFETWKNSITNWLALLSVEIMQFAWIMSKKKHNFNTNVIL